MIYQKRTFYAIIIINTFFISIGIIILASNSNLNRHYQIEATNENFEGSINYQQIDGSYYADIKWVKTIVTLEKTGLGYVTIIVNCTPIKDEHFGIYIRPIKSYEVINIDSAKTYVMNNGQKLEVNYTKGVTSDVSYRIYIKNVSLIQYSETLQYYFSYQADFYLSEQVAHYRVNADLAVIDLLRPTWDAYLDYQEMEIILPVDVGQSVVTQNFLDSIKFDVESYMKVYYDLTYTTKKDSNNNYLLVFNCRKNILAPQSNFEAIFYLAYNNFSLQKIFNWLIMLFVFLFTLIPIALIFPLIIIKNQSKKEVVDFKQSLYKLLRKEKKITPKK